MINTKPYTFDKVIRTLIGLSVVILIFLLLKRLSDVLLPFFIAWLIAYMLNPIVLFFQNKLRLRNRVLSMIATLLLFFGILTGLTLLLIPLISNEVQKLPEIITLYTKNLNISSFLPIAWQHDLTRYFSTLDIQSILKNENIMTLIKKIVPEFWNILNGSLSFIFGITVVLIIFLYLIFILLDFENISNGMFEIVPVKYRNIAKEIISDISTGMNRYFRGQALVAFIVGVLFSIGFSITGLPLAIVLGLFIGILSLVPYLKTIALIPAFFLAFLQSAETGQSYLSVILWLAVIFIIVQTIEDLFLVPKIMGKVTGMNPAVILLSLSVWGSLIGIVGLIIALPLTTLIISYYKRFILKKELVEIPEEEIKAEISTDTDI